MAPIIPAFTACAGVRPNSETVPESGLASPMSRSMVVVLPAPFGPSRATVVPRAVRGLDLELARTAPKDLVSPRATMLSCALSAREESVTEVSGFERRNAPKVLDTTLSPDDYVAKERAW